MLELKGLTYSKDIHGYLLQKDYYTLRTAVSLEDVLTADNATNIDAVVNAYLYRASITFYDYVYSFNSRYKRYIQYQLCHEKDMVELVRECLLDIVNYWTVNGLDSSILNPILNVDVERSVPVVNQADLENSVIPVSVKTKVKNAGLTLSWNRITLSDELLKQYQDEEDGYLED